MQELPDAHTPLLDPPQAPHMGIADAVEDEEVPLVAVVFEFEIFIPVLCCVDCDSCVFDALWVWLPPAELWSPLAELGLHCE